jgi:hypothetical protein
MIKGRDKINQRHSEASVEGWLMSEYDIKELVWQVAADSAEKGPGWAQEGVVLRAIHERVPKNGHDLDLKTQQAILNAWHDLFTEKKLAWGYDLDNPGSPFFHVR